MTDVPLIRGNELFQNLGRSARTQLRDSECFMGRFVLGGVDFGIAPTGCRFIVDSVESKLDVEIDAAPGSIFESARATSPWRSLHYPPKLFIREIPYSGTDMALRSTDPFEGAFVLYLGEHLPMQAWKLRITAVAVDVSGYIEWAGGFVECTISCER